jgi:hypothetical protein
VDQIRWCNVEDVKFLALPRYVDPILKSLTTNKK